ncbi:MAG: transporter substrate-binding domain-containing protein [Clostridia bacterium]|nr:transporter substrate-binding domain-containing protein [Clostridia bacterium]
MKKILSLILCVALCFTLAIGLTSCGYDGKLVVATSPDFPPFESLEGGEVVGIEVEIMEKICKELNYELVFEQIIFESVLPGIETGKYDCGMSGITVTPERAESVLFTDAYYVAAQAIVVAADSAIQSKADLEGKKVSVQLGTTADDFCNKNGYQVSSFEANGDAKLALTTGAVDAWVVDDLTAKQMCEGDEDVVILSEKMTEEPYAFAFNFEDEELVEKINVILNKLIEDGTIKEIFEKYGEVYAAPAN